MTLDRQPIRRRTTVHHDALSVAELGGPTVLQRGVAETIVNDDPGYESPTGIQEYFNIVVEPQDQTHCPPSTADTSVNGNCGHRITTTIECMPESDAAGSKAVEDQVHQLLYMSPQMGRPNPVYRLTTKFHESCTNILELSNETKDVDSLKTVDQDILLVTKSMKHLMPLAIQGLACQQEVQKVFVFYHQTDSEHPTPVADPETHQRLQTIVDELLPAVVRAAHRLLLDLNNSREVVEGHEGETSSVKALNVVDKWGGVVLRFGVGVTNLVNLFQSDVSGAAFHALSMAVQGWNGRKEALAVLKSPAPSEAVIMGKKLKDEVDNLIFHSRVFLATLQELNEHLRSLHAKPGSWNDTVDGVFGAYLVGFDLDDEKIESILSSNAYTAIERRRNSEGRKDGQLNQGWIYRALRSLPLRGTD